MIIPADNADDSAKQDVADSPVASTLRYTESKIAMRREQDFRKNSEVFSISVSPPRCRL